MSYLSKIKQKMSKHFISTKFCIYILFALLPIGLKAQIQVNVNITAPTCNGYTNGSAEASATGGTAPYTYQWSNGQSGSMAFSLSAGSYKVTVMDAASLSIVKDVVLIQPSVIVPSVTAQGGVCATNTTQVASATGGVAPYSFTWKNLGTNATTNGATLTNPTPGSYFLEVTDAKGCNASTVTNITGPLSATVRIGDVVCGGACDGAAEALVVGGKAPYTYKWNYQDKTTQTIFPLPGGSYTVSVTDANGCTAVASGSVFEPDSLKVNLTTTGVCTNNASANVNPTGGKAPYTVKWSNGATGTSVTNLTLGIYFVSVTDANGCIADAQVNVSKEDPIHLMFLKTDPSCSLANGILEGCIPGGGLGPYTFQWSNGATTQVITNVTPGTYKLVVTDAAGCKDSSSITLTNTLSTLATTTSITNTVCSTSVGTATANPTGGTEPYIYKWSNGATTKTINGLGAGNYTVIVTDATGCSVESTVVVNAINASIVVTPSVTDATCGQKNGKVVFDIVGGTAPYSVKWSGGTNTDNLASGNYTYTITDANGCQQIKTAVIGEKGAVVSSFTATPISNTTKCDSVNYNFKNTSTGATSGAIYQWLFSNGKTTTATDASSTFGGASGDARLIVTSADGCTDTSKQSFNLNVMSVEVPDTAATCQNSEVSVLAKTNSNFPVTYNWTPSTIVTAGATTANPTFKPTNVGKNVAYVNITNALGCTISDSVVVTSIAKTAIDPTQISFKQDCDTRKISFTNTSAIANQYRWVFGDPTNPTAGSTATNPTYTYGQGGDVTVTLIPTMSCLDTVKLTVPVRTNPAVSLVANNDSIVCNSDALALKATSNVSKIEWSTTKDFASPISSSTLNVNPANRTNVYYVRATDAQGCVANDSIIVNNFAISVTYAKTIDVCKGVGKQISVTNNTPDVLTATWTPSTLIDGSNTVLNPTIKADADGTLGVKLTNQYGCTLSDNIALKSHEVVASATISESIIYTNDQVTLNAQPTGTGYTYTWTPATDITNPTGATTTANPKQNTTFVVQVTDQFGCKDTASVPVNVLQPECAAPFVFVPTAFSPNGDGINDKIYVRGEYLKSVEFAIYNRWGERVFYTTNQEQGWDGTFNGSPVAPDVYGYYVNGICKQGETFFVKGNITVIR